MPRACAHTAKARAPRRNERMASPERGSEEVGVQERCTRSTHGYRCRSSRGPSGSLPRVSAAAATNAAYQSTQTPAPPCPTGYSCVTIPCATGTCPTVEAGPTKDIGTNPSSTCSSISITSLPGTLLRSGCAPIRVRSRPSASVLDGPAPSTRRYSTTAAGSSPIPSPRSRTTGSNPYRVRYWVTRQRRGLLCDNGPDLCSLDVFDTGLDGSNTPDTSNTAVLPVTYSSEWQRGARRRRFSTPRATSASKD